MVRNLTVRTTVAAMALFLLVPSVVAQFGYPEGKIETFDDHLLADYAYFKTDDPDLVRLEIYYQIHHRGLTFSLSGENYTARYELTVTVTGKDGRQIQSFTRDRQIVLGADEEARTRIDFRTSQINIDLAPGKYQVSFEMKDQTSGRQSHREMDVDLNSLIGKPPQISEIEFAQAFQQGNGQESVFSKGDILVVPSVHRTFGAVAGDRIAYYFEVYPGDEDSEKVVLETKVRHYRRGMVYRDTLHLSIGREPERQLREISLDRMLPGEYELVISLLGRRNKKLAARDQMFRIAWTQDGMIRNDWKAVVRQLELFAEDVDVGDMEKLETVEERIKAFDQFWLERDPTDGTPENEAKTAFYYRVRIANERFGVMQREGWRTDRGRIYIQYGEPDYLVNEPFSPDRRPYQVWYYTSISPNRRFLFIDENEDGDYRLQYPYDGLGTTVGF
ncbi:MAG: GWxTD domain-containing protein [Candidatus Zixiibacteriota bacterium]